jgi:hypothetical protein
MEGSDASDVTNPMPRSLKLESVLMNDPDGKTVFALCSKGESKSIVILNKQPWIEADIKSIVEGADTELIELHRNDKFSKFHGRPPVAMNEVAMSYISPAGDDVIAKYSQQKRYAVRETPAIYTAVTIPYIDAIPAEKCNWVKNCVVDRTKEQDLLMYEDDGCMMFPGKALEWILLLSFRSFAF